MNKHVIVGNLGKNPIVAYTPQNKMVVFLRVATNSFKKSTLENETEWHDVTLCGQIAERVSNANWTEGDLVHVEGPNKMVVKMRPDGQNRRDRVIFARYATRLSTSKNLNYGEFPDPDRHDHEMEEHLTAVAI